MSRQRHAGPAVLLLVVLAVVYGLTANQAIRAAAAGGGSRAAASSATGGTVVKTTPPTTATPVKATTVAAAQKKDQSPGQGQTKMRMRGTTKAQREAARSRQAPQKKGAKVKFAGLNPATAAYSPLALVGTGSITTAATMAAPNAMPDYFAMANWANSPLPTVGSGPITAITITSGGGGYQNPVVTIADTAPGTGSGATATATAVAGVIQSIAVTSGGTGYSNPVVTITDPNGIAAGASAFVSAFGTITGGIRKFVDTLPGLGAGNANNLGTYIPLAVPDTNTFPGSDYYRIGLKEYQHPFHSDLPSPNNLAYPGGTNVRGYFDMGNSADSVPHYLGPFILATKNRPVRVLFNNNIATNLNIPTDITYMGAGMVFDGTNKALASQKRATLHLHGGATPWISDGTPHQWLTPAGGDLQPPALGFQKGMSFMNVPDMIAGSGEPCASNDQLNTPCFAPSLADGVGTFFWTNQQSGKLLFYHDHAYGITRLNVYAGEAAGYLIVDPAEETALGNATVPGTIVTNPGDGTIVSADLAHLVPLVIQDKTFVPDPGTQLPLEDPTWDVTNYGGFGSLWFTHVYMPNQNPYDPSGANPFGRWDWGPWFFPPQDPSTFAPDGQPKPCTSAAYPGQTLVCPGTPLPSGTPEGFMDTPVINGTAYPVLNVTQAAYRFRMLMAGNDRTWNLGIYYAVDKNGVVCKGGNTFDAASCTEMGMVPALPHSATTNPPLCTTNPSFPAYGGLATVPNTAPPLNGTGLQANCWPTTWPTDGRDGGVPDPATAGPPFIQIGTEGGLLPATVVIPSTPVGYEYNRRSITVLNVFSHGLLLGPAERADAIVDFTGVPAGSVLILYNDAPAPVPAFDSRFDYYTGDPDQTSSGGAPSTQPGYGPNTRTIMQIKVAAPGTLPANTTPFSLASLVAAQPALFVATQDQIIVPQTAYPVGNGNGASDTYVRIQDTSINMGTGALSGITLTAAGSGYTSAPLITILPPANGGVQATALATLTPTPVTSLTLTSGGSGYTSVPVVDLIGGGGSGALATAALTPTGVGSVTVTNGDLYTVAPTVTFSGGGGSGATATAALAPTTLASVSLTSSGLGYTLAPLVTISGGGGTGATATATLTPTSVASVALTSGGSNYTSAPVVSFVGNGLNAAAVAGLTPTGVASVAVTSGGSYTFAPPTVAFSGGGGSAASATAALTPTSLASLTLTTGGSGYVSVPAIAITGGGGTGATATATLSVNAVAVTAGGSGYSTPPTVVFTNGGGSGAAASAVMTPTTIQNVALISGGSGYRSAPTVTFVGGGGTGATATANVNRSGVVTGVKVTNGGSGYTSLPTITFTGGGGSGASATATLKPTSVASVVVTNGGSLYTSAPAVSFTGGGTGVGAAATAIMQVGVLSLTSGGTGYTDASLVVVSFTGGGGSGAAATAALSPTPVASVTVTGAGSGYTSAPLVTFSSGTAAGFATLVGTSVGTLSLTNGGSGFTAPPAVSFSGGGGGTGAAASATLTATSVASVAVTNAGSGFTSAPTVSFSAIGGGSGAAATATLTPTPVAAVSVTAPGSGYTSAPGVVFSAGAATAFATLTPTSVASVTLTAGGTGYTSAPTVSFVGGSGSGATAVAGVPPTSVAAVTLTNSGSGYNSAPLVYVSGGGGTGATVVAGAPMGTTPLVPKTIQELFTLDYGRMNATLGVEVPFTNFLTQTTIPYGYVDPPTEIFKDGETQIWKITHNGVDTHFVHFHLFNVQVVNRVGWDGAVKPPDANELSWKDTVRMNPLEDIIVALKPYKQNLPWDLPNSVRPLDVTEPVGSSQPNEFTNVDPTNQPATVTNDLTNFGWEYVWHCHILGHEENDMMRAMVFAVAPVAPSGLNATPAGGGGPVVLTWTDNSLNETGFTVQVSTGAAGPWTTLAVVPGVAGTGSTVTYTDTTSPAGTYYYQVIANNVVGYANAYAAPAAGYPTVSADAMAIVVGPVTK